MTNRILAAVIVLTIYSSASAGLSLIPQSALTAGTTVVFEASFLNDVGATRLDSIGPAPGGFDPLQFQITTPIAPPSPTITDVGNVTPTNGWAFFAFDTDFIAQLPAVAVAPNAMESFAEISVDIPDSFAGDFTISLVEDVRFVGDSGTPLETIFAGTPAAEFDFSVSAVPEPSAFWLLALLGIGFSGMRYWNRSNIA